MNPNPLARYGLKWNPFSPEIPTEACLANPAVENFCWRMENLVRHGGFALITGEVGRGKSTATRILVDRLANLKDAVVRILTRPQSGLADFYREMGDLFGVPLSPHNRWAGAKVLRERWKRHIETQLARAIVIVDEAQEMPTTVLNELRLLSSADLDSRSLLTVVLCGDSRLPEKFESPDLLPLATRIRVRLNLGPATPQELLEYLQHVLREAGNPRLMTAELMATLSEHAAGNLRLLMSLAADLFDAAVQRELDQMDEKLFLEVFSPPAPPPKRVKAQARAR